jgi:hypothetical protein
VPLAVALPALLPAAAMSETPAALVAATPALLPVTAAVAAPVALAVAVPAELPAPSLDAWLENSSSSSDI